MNCPPICGCRRGLRRVPRCHMWKQARVAVMAAAAAGSLAGCANSLPSELAGELSPTSEPNVDGSKAAGLGTVSGASPRLAAKAADTLTAVATPGSSAYKIGPLD